MPLGWVRVRPESAFLDGPQSGRNRVPVRSFAWPLAGGRPWTRWRAVRASYWAGSLVTPEHIQERNSWQRAAALLMEAAENGGSIEAATAQLELVLFLEARYLRR
jgi:hypothetical protein